MLGVSSVISLIGSLVSCALILGAAGTLLDATLLLRDQAEKASLYGGISYGKWNRMLQHPPKKKASRRSIKIGVDASISPEK